MTSILREALNRDNFVHQANSCQYLRAFGFDENRDHLRDAHQRILSVAAIQRDVDGSKLGDAELRNYFN